MQSTQYNSSTKGRLLMHVQLPERRANHPLPRSDPQAQFAQDYAEHMHAIAGVWAVHQPIDDRHGWSPPIRFHPNSHGFIAPDMLGARDGPGRQGRHPPGRLNRAGPGMCAKVDADLKLGKTSAEIEKPPACRNGDGTKAFREKFFTRRLLPKVSLRKRGTPSSPLELI